LVCASARTKQAVASTAAGSLPTETPFSTGTGIREASASPPARNPPAGEDRWEDAARELAQLGRRLLGVVERLGQQGGEILLLVLQGAVCQLQRDDRVDQPRLSAVVQIANYLWALLVGRRRDPRPGRRHLASRFGVFEIAVATSSVKLSRRDSVSAGSDPASGEVATMTPRSARRPRSERGPRSGFACCARRPRLLPWPCVLDADGPLCSAPARRCPSLRGADRSQPGRRRRARPTVTVASTSYLTVLTFSTPRSPATSLATAAKKCDLAAERLACLGHLDADRAATDDEQAPGDLPDHRRLAVRPDALDLVEPCDRREQLAGEPPARITARAPRALRRRW
jgi:hypothetical protein